MKEPVKTVENRWDLLYRDYPEVYDAFAQVKKTPPLSVAKLFKLQGQHVVDIGAGSGKSTFELAKTARFVTGIEPENAMLRLAVKNAAKKRIRNVRFVKGKAERIPLPPHSADAVVAVTVASFSKAGNIRKFVKEASRVVRPGGQIISVEIAPGWYGGDLATVILGSKAACKHASQSENVRYRTFTALGFKHKPFYQMQEYGSMRKILSTYGFIFGKKAIEHLKSQGKTCIKWKIMVYHKKV